MGVICGCAKDIHTKHKEIAYPDSKVHVANMGPTWALSAPDGPHIGPMNLAIRVVFSGDSYNLILLGVLKNVLPISSRIGDMTEKWLKVTFKSSAIPCNAYGTLIIRKPW